MYYYMMYYGMIHKSLQINTVNKLSVTNKLYLYFNSNQSLTNYISV